MIGRHIPNDKCIRRLHNYFLNYSNKKNRVQQDSLLHDNNCNCNTNDHESLKGIAVFINRQTKQELKKIIFTFIFLVP